MKKFAPVYFLMGEEPYFIDLITDYIEDHVLDEASKAFGQTIMYGRDVSLRQILSLAQSFPMMGDKQVLIVKEAQDLDEWKKSENLEILEKYLTHPTPSTLLVFSFKGKGPDKRTRLFKSLDKSGVVFESTKVKEYKMPEWIEKYVQHKGFKIPAAVAQMLAEYLGTSLSKVVNEMNKLAIVLPAGATITAQIVEENIGISKDYNVWELQKALGQKDVLKANRIIDYFEANPKENPIQKVIPSLFGYFNKLNIYQALKDKKDAAKEMGMNPYALNDYKEAAKKYSPAKLESIISYLRETDRKSKGVENYSVSSGELMKELTFKILH
ncbi:MAG: DNA polymerase III subunit delta [Crocinitomicaceae bacterium]|nr:DNA polymerase III subunit delta [Crocinitomicaceae bacterium]